MKVNKTQSLMFILHRLLLKGEVTKAEILERIDVNDLTFRRYMQELRAYFRNFNTSCDLVYKKNNDMYVLTKE